jgi:hypothetical protein
VTFVLDNSVAIAWCFEDEQTPALLDLLRRVTESGAFAPTLWPLEAINACLLPIGGAGSRGIAADAFAVSSEPCL